jgi:hypothetical protein
VKRRRALDVDVEVGGMVSHPLTKTVVVFEDEVVRLIFRCSGGSLHRESSPLVLRPPQKASRLFRMFEVPAS